jgi:GNAT superfamily N-acetyltransferase
LSIHVKEVDENLFDDEINLCLPPNLGSESAAFQKGIEEKRRWLKKRLNEFGSVASVAYHEQQPIGFIEYVSARNAPVPIDEAEKVAIITCVNKPKFPGKGVGTTLIRAALKKLKQTRIEQVKTLVSRSSYWINSGIYSKNGFVLEKTFYKPGAAEPLDLLTFNLKGAQKPVAEPFTVRFPQMISNSLPVGIVYFCSGQCPFNALVRSRLMGALEKFDSKRVVLEVFDSWENCKLARECGAMYGDLFVNGKTPFAGPVSQENIEKKIREEIERIRALEL